MEMAEAIKDAREQFEKQGINLGNIVISEKGSQVVVDAVQDLFKDLPDEEVLVRLKTIQDCCKDDLAQRVLAKLVRAATDSAVQLEVVRTLTSVMNTNPDM